MVRSAAAVKYVVAALPVEGVVAGATAGVVLAASAPQRVVSVPAEKLIFSCASPAGDSIVACPPEQSVRPRASDDLIVAVSAIQVVVSVVRRISRRRGLLISNAVSSWRFPAATSVLGPLVRWLS